MRHGMSTASILLALLVGAAPAQNQNESFTPFTGVVNANNVNVRAGMGKNYYPVTQLHRGDTVRVMGLRYGWYKIVPPPETFSYISKAYVRARGDGSTGVVTGDNVRVRAPSPAGPDPSYATQTLLDEGAKVTIIGSQGSFYKIAPPEHAMLYIDATFVDPKGSLQGGPTTPSATSTTHAQMRQAAMRRSSRPSSQTGSQKFDPDLVIHVSSDGTLSVAGRVYSRQVLKRKLKEAVRIKPGLTLSIRSALSVDQDRLARVVSLIRSAGVKSRNLRFAVPQSLQNVAQPSSPSPAPPPSASPSPSRATQEQTEEAASQEAHPEKKKKPEQPSAHDKLRKLAGRLKQISKLPLAEQPLSEVERSFEQLITQAKLSDRDRNIARAYLSIIHTRQALLASMHAIDNYQQQLAQNMQRRKASRADAPTHYSLKGRLTTSILYTGEELPLLYRLVDPQTGVTEVYVRPQPDHSLTPLLGEYIGVVGSRHYDKSLELKIIEVRRAEPLHTSEQGTTRR